jgi:hypothetical protein
MREYKIQIEVEEMSFLRSAIRAYDGLNLLSDNFYRKSPTSNLTRAVRLLCWGIVLKWISEEENVRTQTELRTLVNVVMKL